MVEPEHLSNGTDELSALSRLDLEALPRLLYATFSTMKDG
jgi:hypothetical protein